MKKLITLKLKQELLTWADTYASRLGCDRTELITLLLEKAMVEDQALTYPLAEPQVIVNAYARQQQCQESKQHTITRKGKSKTVAEAAFPVEVPDHLQVFRICDSGHCINPTHLYVGENSQHPRRWMHQVLAFPISYPPEIQHIAHISNLNLHKKDNE